MKQKHIENERQEENVKVEDLPVDEATEDEVKGGYSIWPADREN